MKANPDSLRLETDIRAAGLVDRVGGATRLIEELPLPDVRKFAIAIVDATRSIGLPDVHAVSAPPQRFESELVSNRSREFGNPPVSLSVDRLAPNRSRDGNAQGRHGLESRKDMTVQLSQHRAAGLRPAALLNGGSSETPPDPDDVRMVLALISGLLRRLDRSDLAHDIAEPRLAATSGGLPPRRLRCVLDYVEKNLGSEICMGTLAEIACVSQFHFIRCFRQSMGIPPHRYIMQRRVERAKLKLLQTSDSVVQIALDCGFADQSHLSTHFRRSVGTTPSRFRREHL